MIPITMLTFILYGCAASIHSFNDEATKAQISRMSGNKLAGGFCRLEMGTQRHEKNGKITYSLFIVYRGPFFVTIDPGKSLTLTIDNRRTEIEGSGSERHRDIISLGLVEETAFYHDIDRELIRQIAYAHWVAVEVRGRSALLQRYFTEINSSNFKSFYEDFVSKDITSDNLSSGGQKVIAK